MCLMSLLFKHVFVLCVLDFGPMQYPIYVFMLVVMIMLCHVHLVSPDFGQMQLAGLRSNAGGKAPVSPDFGPMQ